MSNGVGGTGAGVDILVDDFEQIIAQIFVGVSLLIAVDMAFNRCVIWQILDAKPDPGIRIFEKFLRNLAAESVFSGLSFGQ